LFDAPALWGGSKQGTFLEREKAILQMPFALVAVLLVMLALVCVFAVFLVVRRWL